MARTMLERLVGSSAATPAPEHPPFWVVYDPEEDKYWIAEDGWTVDLEDARPFSAIDAAAIQVIPGGDGNVLREIYPARFSIFTPTSAQFYEVGTGWGYFEHATMLSHRETIGFHKPRAPGLRSTNGVVFVREAPWDFEWDPAVMSQVVLAELMEDSPLVTMRDVVYAFETGSALEGEYMEFLRKVDACLSYLPRAPGLFSFMSVTRIAFAGVTRFSNTSPRTSRRLSASAERVLDRIAAAPMRQYIRGRIRNGELVIRITYRTGSFRRGTEECRIRYTV